MLLLPQVQCGPQPCWPPPAAASPISPLSSEVSYLCLVPPGGWVEQKWEKGHIWCCCVSSLGSCPSPVSQVMKTCYGRGRMLVLPETLQRHHSPWATWLSVTSLACLLGSGPPQYTLSILTLGSSHKADWPPAFIILHDIPKVPGTDSLKHELYWHLFWLLEDCPLTYSWLHNFTLNYDVFNKNSDVKWGQYYIFI